MKSLKTLIRSSAFAIVIWEREGLHRYGSFSSYYSNCLTSFSSLFLRISIFHSLKTTWVNQFNIQGRYQIWHAQMSFVLESVFLPMKLACSNVVSYMQLYWIEGYLYMIQLIISHIYKPQFIWPPTVLGHLSVLEIWWQRSLTAPQPSELPLQKI